MPNWCGNVVAVFVPKMLAGLAPAIVEAMRGRDAESEDINWFDLDKLLPSPPELEAGFSQEIVDAVQGDAMAQLLPMEIRHLLPHQGGLSDEDREAAVAALPENMRDEVERAQACYDLHGTLSGYQWRMDKWGVRYCGCDDEPRIDQEPADEYDEQDTVMIRWVFHSPNNWPKGAARRLAAVCRHWGFGLRWWISGEDGGTSWDPVSEEHVTIWQDASDEEPTVTVASRAPSCLSDAVTMLGRPFALTTDDNEKEHA